MVWGFVFFANVYLKIPKNIPKILTKCKHYCTGKIGFIVLKQIRQLETA